jgi:hypothetical protein
MRKARIAVAKYHEETGWLSEASNYDIFVTIYDKSNPELVDVNSIVKVSDNHFMLPNIGREAQTYIKHIVENYDNLYDVEVFSQGRISDHVSNFWGKLSSFLEGNEDYIDFCDNTKISCLNEISYQKISKEYPHVDINDRGSGSYIFLAAEGNKKLYRMTHGEIPESENAYVKFGLHAVFAVSAERIRSIPIETYKKMLDLFKVKGSSYSDTNSHIYWAYEFEYTWKHIFSNPIK